MRTNIDIDDKLIKEALKHSKLNTKKEVVNMALYEFVKNHKRKLLLTLKGQVKWEGNLNKLRTYDKWDNS
jgi:Arc/MetJ family transcription regulator